MLCADQGDRPEKSPTGWSSPGLRAEQLGPAAERHRQKVTKSRAVFANCGLAALATLSQPPRDRKRTRTNKTQEVRTGKQEKGTRGENGGALEEVGGFYIAEYWVNLNC